MSSKELQTSRQANVFINMSSPTSSSSSSSHQDVRRRNLCIETEYNGLEMSPCTNCRKSKPKLGQPRPKCVVGPKSGRCSECIRKGRRCDVTVYRAEWERLRDNRERLRKELERAEEKARELLEQLLTHTARTVRLRKQVHRAETHTDQAVAQELEILEAIEDEEKAMLLMPSPNAAATMPFSFNGNSNMSSSAWGSLDKIPTNSWIMPQSYAELVQ